MRYMKCRYIDESQDRKNSEKKNWDNRVVYGNQIFLSKISVKAFYLPARWKQDCFHACQGICFFCGHRVSCFWAIFKLLYLIICR